MITTGAIAVTKLLVGNCTLQVLQLGYNDIGDDGISMIVEQLQHITTLNVEQCGLSVKGIVAHMVHMYVKYIAMAISLDSEDYLTVSLVVRLFSLPSISGHR